MMLQSENSIVYMLTRLGWEQSILSLCRAYLKPQSKS